LGVYGIVYVAYKLSGNLSGSRAFLSGLYFLLNMTGPISSIGYAGLFGILNPSLDGYDFVNLSALMLLAYSASFLLYRGGMVSLRAHRMVWNILLLFTFLVCAVLGVLLVLKINYGIVYALPFNMLYWHVEAGIAMTAISVFHIIWHRSYFKAILSGAKSGSEAGLPRQGVRRAGGGGRK